MSTTLMGSAGDSRPELRDRRARRMHVLRQRAGFTRPPSGDRIERKGERLLRVAVQREARPPLVCHVYPSQPELRGEVMADARADEVDQGNRVRARERPGAARVLEEGVQLG